MSSPAALANSEKWDHSIENALRKTSLGFAFGLPLSLVFARSMAARAGVVALGAGIGSGMAYAEAKYLFEHGVTFDRRHIVSVELFKPVE